MLGVLAEFHSVPLRRGVLPLSLHIGTADFDGGALVAATRTEIPVWKELEILAVLLLTSKTAAAVTGGGFIALAATLSAVGDVPIAGLTLLLGIDRAMSEGRAITNLIGNGVAAVAVSRWERELDAPRARAVLSDVATVEAEEYEAGRIDPKAAVPEAAKPGPV